jgi:hypothetical protein
MNGADEKNSWSCVLRDDIEYDIDGLVDVAAA